MTFTELVRELKATYPDRPRAFHVLAARFYLGFEKLEELRQRACRHLSTSDGRRTGHTGDHYTAPELTEAQVQEIINNR